MTDFSKYTVSMISSKRYKVTLKGMSGQLFIGSIQDCEAFIRLREAGVIK